MKEIIWVFGTSSAVGKKTFCDYIINEPSSDLIAKLQLEGKKLSISKVSVDVTAQYYGDKSEQSRLGISNEVKQLLRVNDVVFIKWQYKDMENGVFDKVNESSSGVKVRVILLDAEPSQSAARLSQKNWWKENYSGDDPLEFVKNERNKVLEVLDNMKNKYPVTTIRSNPNYNFQ